MLDLLAVTIAAYGAVCGLSLHKQRCSKRWTGFPNTTQQETAQQNCWTILPGVPLETRI